MMIEDKACTKLFIKTVFWFKRSDWTDRDNIDRSA